MEYIPPLYINMGGIYTYIRKKEKRGQSCRGVKIGQTKLYRNVYRGLGNPLNSFYIFSYWGYLYETEKGYKFMMSVICYLHLILCNNSKLILDFFFEVANT